MVKIEKIKDEIYINGKKLTHSSKLSIEEEKALNNYITTLTRGIKIQSTVR